MTTLRGTLATWNGANYLAGVRLDGSALAVASGLRTSRAIASAEMVPGRVVLVDAGDETGPREMVVIAVFS
jgi:hypothetical protein